MDDYVIASCVLSRKFNHDRVVLGIRGRKAKENRCYDTTATDNDMGNSNLHKIPLPNIYQVILLHCDVRANNRQKSISYTLAI